MATISARSLEVRKATLAQVLSRQQPASGSMSRHVNSRPVGPMGLGGTSSSRCVLVLARKRMLLAGLWEMRDLSRKRYKAEVV